MITNAAEKTAALWERVNWVTSTLFPTPSPMLLWWSASPAPGDLRAVVIRITLGLQFLWYSNQSLWPHHMDVSPATILGSLALLQPVIKFPFLLSTVLIPLGTNESLRQLINKPESTSGDSSFISLLRLPVQIPFDLSIELQIRQEESYVWILLIYGLLGFYQITLIHLCYINEKCDPHTKNHIQTCWYRGRHVVLFCLYTYTHLPDCWSNVTQNSSFFLAIEQPALGVWWPGRTEIAISMLTISANRKSTASYTTDTVPATGDNPSSDLRVSFFPGSSQRISVKQLQTPVTRHLRDTWVLG